MANKVLFHPLADADLEAIYRFIAKDSPDRAIGFVQRIQTFCETLPSMPLRGRNRRELGEGVRTLVLGRRVVVAYRLVSDQILILRIFYAGQNIDQDKLPKP